MIQNLNGAGDLVNAQAGTDIKTINGASLLGAGNIPVMAPPPATPAEGTFVGTAAGGWKQGSSLVEQTATPALAANLGTLQTTSIIRKSGKIVELVLVSNGNNPSAIANGTTLMTLPEGFRPGSQIIATGSTWANPNVMKQIYINPNGTVVIGEGAVWAANTIFIFHCAFMTPSATWIGAVGSVDGAVSPVSGVNMSAVTCRKSGNTVAVSLMLTTTAAKAAATPLFTLPAGFRPSIESCYVCSELGIPNTPHQGWLHADGTYTVDEALPSGKLLAINFAFNTNEVSQVQIATTTGAVTAGALVTDASRTVLMKSGRTVTLNYLSTNVTAEIPVSTTLFTIPEGYRPAGIPVMIAARWNPSETGVRIYFNANGTVQSSDSIPAGSQLCFSISWTTA